jgi:hypothetical protein
MGNRQRILVGSALALAVSGIVAGAAVSAFANGPNDEWTRPAAVEWQGPAHVAVSNPTAVEYASSSGTVANLTLIEL